MPAKRHGYPTFPGRRVSMGAVLKNWTTPQKVLKHESLQELEGIYLNVNCQSCRILKSNEILKEGYELELTSIDNGGFTAQLVCLKKTFSLKSSYNFLATNSFFPACTLEDARCQKSLGVVTAANGCLQVVKSLLVAALPIGIIGMFLNVIVFVVTLSTKLLRQHPYLILVSFLAIGDTIAGIYMTVVASVYQAMPLVEFDTKRKVYCDYIGFLVIFADVITINISFLLTIERYLATVLWSRPNVRMKMKHVLLVLFLSILIGLALSVWGLFDDYLNVGGFARYICYPIPDLKNQQYRVYTISVVAAAILVHVVTVAMYLHIFIVARNSGRQLGIVREATLAKKIGTMVFTNVIFHFLPFAFAVVVITTGSFAGSSAEVSVAIVVGCLVILPGINSIMNPILYGYKNDKFRRSLQTRIHCSTSRVNSSRQERTANSPPVILLSHKTNKEHTGGTLGQNRHSKTNKVAPLSLVITHNP